MRVEHADVRPTTTAMIARAAATAHLVAASRRIAVG
jgi:hypothetical protein